jgi:hypothetical protein
MATKIVKCACNHQQQDKLHGKNMRVANTTTGKVLDSQVTVRCTVCNKEQVVAK